jgi:flagellar protein FlgJ
MDIENIGSRYLDNARFSVQAPLAAGRGEYGGTGGAFATLLEKSLRQKAGREDAPSAASQSVARGPVVDKTDKLYEQCEALETFLVKILLNSMRNTVQKTGLLEESFAGKMYEDMLYDEYARDFTKNAGFGLAELAYLELTGQRGKAPPR